LADYVTGVRRYHPRKVFEYTDAKSYILAHFDIKNYLLRTSVAEVKKICCSGAALVFLSDWSQKLDGIEAHPSPHPNYWGIYPLHPHRNRRPRKQNTSCNVKASVGDDNYYK
jgi:hypothetical protein